MQQKKSSVNFTDDLASLLFPFTPPFSVKHCLMRFFARRPQCVISLFSFLADRPKKFDSILGQSVIPTSKPIFAAGMQLFTIAFPKPLLQGATSDNVHKIATLRAKRAMPDLPAGNPGLHQEVAKKILGSMYGMGKIKNFIPLGNQNPAGVFFPGHLLFQKPSGPNQDSVLIGVKKIPKLSAKTGTRSYELQSPKLQSEFRT